MEVMQGPHATQTARKRVIDHLRERSRQGRVKGVTALLEYLCPHLGTTRLRTYDYTFHEISRIF
jgi:hypothetical protein